MRGATDAAARGRTTSTVAHRLATERRAGRILVFHDGRIVEDGSFDGLLRRRRSATSAIAEAAIQRC